ncbi:MAG: aspartate carbamoyltransferase [Patescibacteria group bacterium]
MSTFLNRDVISIKDFTKEEILKVLQVAKKFKQKPAGQLLAGKVIGSLFFEPSTRTKLSFDTAAKRLGAEVIGFSDPSTTSVKKGEILQDSIKIVANYADLIVMRHPAEGSARLAAEVTDKPIINGGDGANQHPTQTMLDLFTIQETQGKLDGLNIAMMGDLKYGRTVHSLAQALTHFKTKLYFISPDSLKMPENIKTELKEKKIPYSEYRHLSEIINKIDILYDTRIQKERFPDVMDYEKVKNLYIVHLTDLEKAKKNLKILHPLPRVNEIEYKIDKTPYAYYFQQAGNGLYVRQALLALVLGAIK